MRKEIISILTSEWGWSKAQAERLLQNERIYRQLEVSRRKYHALPKDFWTPSLPPVYEWDFENPAHAPRSICKTVTSKQRARKRKP